MVEPVVACLPTMNDEVARNFSFEVGRIYNPEKSSDALFVPVVSRPQDGITGIRLVNDLPYPLSRFANIDWLIDAVERFFVLDPDGIEQMLDYITEVYLVQGRTLPERSVLQERGAAAFEPEFVAQSLELVRQSLQDVRLSRDEEFELRAFVLTFTKIISQKVAPEESPEQNLFVLTPNQAMALGFSKAQDLNQIVESRLVFGYGFSVPDAIAYVSARELQTGGIYQDLEDVPSGTISSESLARLASEIDAGRAYLGDPDEPLPRIAPELLSQLSQ